MGRTNVLVSAEKEYLTGQTHRVLVNIVARWNDELARQMGLVTNDDEA